MSSTLRSLNKQIVCIFKIEADIHNATYLKWVCSTEFNRKAASKIQVASSEETQGLLRKALASYVHTFLKLCFYIRLEAWIFQSFIWSIICMAVMEVVQQTHARHF